MLLLRAVENELESDIRKSDLQTICHDFSKALKAKQEDDLKSKDVPTVAAKYSDIDQRIARDVQRLLDCFLDEAYERPKPSFEMSPIFG